MRIGAPDPGTFRVLALLPSGVARLVRIRALREVGLGLDEIGGLLDAEVPVEALTEAFDTLRADLHHRAAARAGMSEAVEQLLTGAAAAQLAWLRRTNGQTDRVTIRSGTASSR